jgi:hypothetical protein
MSPYDRARAIARTFVDVLDRDYALMYLAWLAAHKQSRKPVYQGVGSAERIESAIDNALTV